MLMWQSHYYKVQSLNDDMKSKKCVILSVKCHNYEMQSQNYDMKRRKKIHTKQQ